MGVSISTLHPSGLDLFSVAENFLTDLSAEDESMVSGGGRHRKSRSKTSKSKSKSKSRKRGYGWYH